MVFVAVGDKNAFDAVLFVLEIGNVGNENVDAGHRLVRKTNSAVNDQNFAAVFVNVHVTSDIARPTQGDIFKDLFV